MHPAQDKVCVGRIRCEPFASSELFLQRFGAAVKEPRRLNHRNAVTSNVQAGANLHGRTWAMMYDLSGMQPGAIEKRVMEDWKLLVDRMKIREDRAYLHHEGQPGGSGLGGGI